jgi:hypothetical protein
MKKLILILLSLAGAGLTAQAQLENYGIIPAPVGGPILVGGAAPAPVPVVYDQPVTYNAPVQYYAPVQYNAPVFYNTLPPAPTAPVCVPPPCASYPTTSVQVIVFGQRQAAQQGYAFAAQR